MQPPYPVYSAPHIHEGTTSARLYAALSLALLPALFFGSGLFGWISLAKVLGLGLMTFVMEALIHKCFRQPFPWRNGQSIFSILIFLVLIPWPASFLMSAAAAVCFAILRFLVSQGLPFHPAAAALLMAAIFPSRNFESAAPVLTGWMAWGLQDPLAVNFFGAAGWWPVVIAGGIFFYSRRIRWDAPVLCILLGVFGFLLAGVPLSEKLLLYWTYLSLFLFSEPLHLPLTHTGRAAAACITGGLAGFFSGGESSGMLAGILAGNIMIPWIDHWIRSDRRSFYRSGVSSCR